MGNEDVSLSKYPNNLMKTKRIESSYEKSRNEDGEKKCSLILPHIVTTVEPITLQRTSRNPAKFFKFMKIISAHIT